ncbi:hypothetical protein LZ30DRAFT_782878 [Colletotrichum cereale]|nr:hypothetical protein LZ30DRAFT_782878 [Colletotrichum cereale]
MIPPRPLSEDERNSYYRGLLSQPRLVARSSSTPLQTDMTRLPSLSKTLGVVGQHAIVGKWNDEPSPLQNRILEILTGEKVDWRALDVFRIGYAGDEMPVILWITVAAGALSHEAGHRVAWRCREALQEHGLDDVHCEIKEPRMVDHRSGFGVTMAPVVPVVPVVPVARCIHHNDEDDEDEDDEDDDEDDDYDNNDVDRPVTTQTLTSTMATSSTGPAGQAVTARDN